MSAPGAPEPQAGKPADLVRQRRLVARLVGLLALVTVFAAPLAPYVLRAFQPQLVVDSFFDRDFVTIARLAQKGQRLDDAAKDPWGRAWHLRSLQVGSNEMQEHVEHKHWVLGFDADPKQTFTIYSAGPDGRDDGGHGDDLFPVAHSAAVWVPISHADELVGALAVVLFWWRLWLVPRRRGNFAELLFAVALAALPTAFAAGGVLWTREERSRKQALPPTPFVLVPQELAVVGSVAFAALVLAVGLRQVGATRLVPREPDDEEESASRAP